jgi:hypothetical protein
MGAGTKNQNAGEGQQQFSSQAVGTRQLFMSQSPANKDVIMVLEQSPLLEADTKQ